ncbi:carboxymuconolactone decarboxylase family protein [Arthrobacter zhaoguopingii]|uniref:carboxymuconolactone decarboxylase family protein n=1 Tax=Arthrobacter zhaoguopingii TaxID=2681491 RepID=UPI0013592EDF|nr:carboxymuconolactone decarboxylase family protein [Arthrobacter zhaoguopingii]
MTIKAQPRRTNIGSEHPETYRALAEVAKRAEEAALAEGLTPVLIELVKIRVSQINGCAFCLRIHTLDALAKGAGAERLSLLPAWRESGYFDEKERSALALAEYITDIRDSHSNTGLYGSAAAHLSSGQMSAVSWVALVINSYNRIALSSAYEVNP